MSTRGVKVFPNHLVGQAAAPLPVTAGGPLDDGGQQLEHGLGLAARGERPSAFLELADAVVEVADAEPPEAADPGAPA